MILLQKLAKQFGALFLGAAFFSQCVNASEIETFDQYLNELQRLSAIKTPRASVASISSGFGASGGQSYIAVSYSSHDTQTSGQDDDGSIALGYGLGNPSEALGLELTASITSVSTSFWGDGKFADEGNISLKLHKRIEPIGLGAAASISLGASNLVGWGGTREVPTNYNLSYSALGYIGAYNQYAYNITFGYGSAVANVEKEGAVFYGIGIGSGDFSGSIAYNGDEVNVGVTYFVPNVSGASLGVILGDATGSNDRKRTMVTIAKSW